MESEFYEYDNFDLTSRPSTNQFQVQPLQPETVKDFLPKVFQQDLLPKEVKKAWNNAKSERQKLVKQFNERQLNDNSAEIDKLHRTMLADCLSES